MVVTAEQAVARHPVFVSQRTVAVKRGRDYYAMMLQAKLSPCSSARTAALVGSELKSYR